MSGDVIVSWFIFIVVSFGIIGYCLYGIFCEPIEDLAFFVGGKLRKKWASDKRFELAEFNRLVKRHNKIPKYLKEGCSFQYVDTSYWMRSGISHHTGMEYNGHLIYNDGFKYEEREHLGFYLEALRDEVSWLEERERRHNRETEKRLKALRRAEEEDLRKHPWKKHRCSECKYYWWRCYIDGDIEAKCTKTGYLYSNSEANSFGSGTACKDFNDGCY